jgi:hypothetical protein
VKPATLEPGSNWGTLILDATCVPDDIPYPVDLRLLDEARESTEGHLEKSPIEEQMVTHKKTAASCRACNKYSYS